MFKSALLFFIYSDAKYPHLRKFKISHANSVAFPFLLGNLSLYFLTELSYFEGAKVCWNREKVMH